MHTTPDYVRAYTPRTWRVYQLPFEDFSGLPLASPDLQLQWCNSDSPMAARYGDNPRLFYVDVELQAAGLDSGVSAGEPDRLVVNWTAPDGVVYPEGSLILTLDRGSERSKPRQDWTREYCVEVVQP